MKDIVLTFDYVEQQLVDAIMMHSDELGYPLRGVVLSDIGLQGVPGRIHDREGIFTEVFVNFDDPADIDQKLAPYVEDVLLATARYERSVQHFASTIPFLQSTHVPTIESLYDSSHKKLMRDKLKAYDESLVPGYVYMDDGDVENAIAATENFSYPVIVKPTGLSKSLLVSVCHAKEELRATLTSTLAKINNIYDTTHHPGVPSLLIEEMMYGDMYSIDAYVLPDGKIYCLPPVQVITAHSVGLKGFYGYERTLPATLDETDLQGAYEASMKSILALGLKSTTVHIELFKTPDGWKIIELGARIGGFRGKMYGLVYDINHFYNDLAIRMGIKPKIETDVITNHVKVLNIFAEQEGVIEYIEGLEVLDQNPCVEFYSVNRSVGDLAVDSQNGGESIINVILKGVDKYQLDQAAHSIRQKIVFHIGSH